MELEQPTRASMSPQDTWSLAGRHASRPWPLPCTRLPVPGQWKGLVSKARLQSNMRFRALRGLKGREARDGTAPWCPSRLRETRDECWFASVCVGPPAAAVSGPTGESTLRHAPTRSGAAQGGVGRSDVRLCPHRSRNKTVSAHKHKQIKSYFLN